jgi:potassium inwardly-rectifying channel subfamily J
VESADQKHRPDAARHIRRLAQKGGEFNIMNVGVTKREQKYLADTFTTLVDMRWRYHVLFFMTQYLIQWLLFGTIYYTIAVTRGDIENKNNKTWVPCVCKVYDYSSALMFAFETQTTIGYGVRVIDPVCGIGVFVVMSQSCIGTFVQVAVFLCKRSVCFRLFTDTMN